MISATAVQGSRFQDFSLGLSQGFAVTLVAHLVSPSPQFGQLLPGDVARRTREGVGRASPSAMHGAYEPAPDIEAQVFKAISSKKQAWSAPAREFCSTLKWPVQAISWLQHLFSRAPPSTFSRSCFESLAVQAALRQPPNLLQVAFAFGRVVESKGRVSRKTAPVILNEVIKDRSGVSVWKSPSWEVGRGSQRPNLAAPVFRLSHTAFQGS